MFLAEVEVKRRKDPAFVAELETPKPLLGVYALEILGFKVNPRTGEIEEISPEGGYLLTAQVSEDELIKKKYKNVRIGLKDYKERQEVEITSLKVIDIGCGNFFVIKKDINVRSL